MTHDDRARSWLSKMDLKAYAGMMVFLTCVVAITVFGIVPSQSLLAVNAFLSGCVWSMCVGIIVIGGHRIKSGYLCAACLIAGGLTTSIPAIFFEHTVVDWGSTVSRLGLLVLLVQVVVDLWYRITMEQRT